VRDNERSKMIPLGGGFRVKKNLSGCFGWGRGLLGGGNRQGSDTTSTLLRVGLTT
jgi:hypothetical protein